MSYKDTMKMVNMRRIYRIGDMSNFFSSIVFNFNRKYIIPHEDTTTFYILHDYYVDMT